MTLNNANIADELGPAIRNLVEAASASTLEGLMSRGDQILRARRIRMAVVLVASVTCIAVAVTVALHLGSSPRVVDVRTQPDPNHVSTPAHEPEAPPPGKDAVGDHDGNEVGFVDSSLLHPIGPEAMAAVTPEALLPVEDIHGTLVGYWAWDYGFVSLTEASVPGFDIIKARIARNGGCMSEIGQMGVHPPSEYGVPACR